MGNIGVPELLVIALIALLLFGAGRLADIGKGLGQGIKNFKQGLKEAGDEDDDKPAEKKKEAKDTKSKKDDDEKESKDSKEAAKEA
jgi:sec-independent protein translocase protein TatA